MYLRTYNGSPTEVAPRPQIQMLIDVIRILNLPRYTFVKNYEYGCIFNWVVYRDQHNM